jgi:hypothetical protein
VINIQFHRKFAAPDIFLGTKSKNNKKKQNTARQKTKDGTGSQPIVPEENSEGKEDSPGEVPSQAVSAIRWSFVRLQLKSTD